MYSLLESKLRRTKSTGDLDAINSRFDSKCVKCSFANCSNFSNEYESLLDSLNKSHRQIFDLKHKNQKLRGMVKQQQCILNTIKDDTNISYRNIVASFIEESLKTMDEMGPCFEDVDYCEDIPNNQAKSLLAAIEPKHSQARGDMTDALTMLANKFDEHRDRFNLEKGSDLLLKRMLKASPPDVAVESPKRGICREMKNQELQRQWWKSYDHREDPICENMKPKLSFYKELKASPDILPKVSMPLVQVEPISKPGPISLETLVDRATADPYEEELKVPPSPPQPADPEVSIIDHLMQSAVINKKISEGDFNGSFLEALSHCNLALVMSACRAVDPAEVFSPCSLSQAVLLSLVQQLATDMVHETQLKCRYLEEALINLEVSDQVTHMYLPLVVGEVRKHLSKFVRAYPHHVANRRISLIIMAADNLIK